MPRSADIAIYAPYANVIYERRQKSDRPANRRGGGAELQTALLAQGLAENGLEVAHIVYPVRKPRKLTPPAPKLVVRPRYAGNKPPGLGTLREFWLAWRSIAKANASLYLFRGGSGQLAIVALYCVLRRRKLVLSASNDLDFEFDRPDRSRIAMGLYRLALRAVDAIVVQSAQQLELAREALGDELPIDVIPSFSEPAEEGDASDPEGFLWAARLVEYKLPLSYVDLAREVPEERFRMIGMPTSETPASMTEQIDEADAELDNLELVAPRRREWVLTRIERSIAVVLTSRYEGMPNVFLEAWARGIPVLSLHFDPDGKIEREGLGICAQGDWQRFVEGARALASDSDLRARLGANGRRYVREVHSVEAVGKRWAQAAGEVLHGADAASR